MPRTNLNPGAANTPRVWAQLGCVIIIIIAATPVGGPGGYALIIGTRPQTLSGLADSPAGLAVAERSSPGADRKAFWGG
jgi:hypothetical protein